MISTMEMFAVGLTVQLFMMCGTLLWLYGKYIKTLELEKSGEKDGA